MFPIILYMEGIDDPNHAHYSEYIGKDLAQFIYIAKSQLSTKKLINPKDAMGHIYNSKKSQQGQ